MPIAPEISEAEFLDYRLLRLFDLLYATHSVTRAAEQLGQTQPTVSSWLGTLRRKLGDPLFVRAAGGMRPTPRADALIGAARQALRSLTELAQAPPVFEPQTAERLFRVCMTDGNHIILLPRLLERVRALAPRVRLAAANIGDDIAETLQSGVADLALGPDPRAGGRRVLPAGPVPPGLGVRGQRQPPAPEAKSHTEAIPQ